MLTFLNVSHQAVTANPAAPLRLQRAAHQTGLLDQFDPVLEDRHRNDNARGRSTWSCQSLRDFRCIQQDVRRHPLRAWEHAKRFGSQAAVAGVGAGVVVSLSLGVLFWPLGVAGGLLGAVLGGCSQYSALELAERFDQALDGLGDIARAAQGQGANFDSLQQHLRRRNRQFGHLGPAYAAVAQRLDHLLEEAKTNPAVAKCHELFS